MEVIYAQREASVNDIVAGIPLPPSHTAVRTFLRILEEKGHLSHRKVGKENIYRPTRVRANVAKGALRKLLDTFFGGSIENALATHLADPKVDLSEEDLTRLRDLIEQARSQEK